jgi:membrane protein implicated in regulation of membrane protease activity
VNRTPASWFVMVRAVLAALCLLAALVLLSLPPTWIESTTDVELGRRDGTLEMVASMTLAGLAVVLIYSVARSTRRRAAG